METVGTREARTRWASLLDRVEQGETITITRHGRPVARLAPVEAQDRRRAREAADRLQARRRRLSGASVDELVQTIHETRTP